MTEIQLPSSSTKSTYSIVPATRKDISEIAACFYAAFAKDAVVAQLECDCDPEERTKVMEAWYARQFDRVDMGISGTRIFKAVDNKGNLAGYGKWIFPITLSADQEAQVARLDEEAKALPTAPGTNTALMTSFFGALDANRKKHVDPTRDYFMHILCVSPSHHRQGIGGLILKHVLDQCDAEGANCYIEASAAGLPLYLRMGWEVVDEISMDMEKNGAKGGVVRQKCLWRVPKVQ